MISTESWQETAWHLDNKYGSLCVIKVNKKREAVLCIFQKEISFLVL